MAIITKIEPLPRAKKRWSIYVQEEKWGVIDARLAREKSLAVGKELSREDWAALLQAEVSPAFNIALYYLSRSARSQEEMAKYLRVRQYAPQVIDAVLEKLKDYKFIDDEALSERTVANLQQQTLGRAAIERKLRSRGVDKELARSALLEYSPEDEDQNARRLAEQLWQRHQKDDLPKRRQKVAAALARRGFSWDMIHSAMQSLSDQDGEENEV